MTDYTFYGWHDPAITVTLVGNNDMGAALDGVSIDPASYITGTLNAPGTDYIINDLDTDDGDTVDADEGVTIGGVFHQIDEHVTYENTTIMMDDGTSFNIKIFAHLLDDGSVLWKLNDSDTQSLLDAGYGYNDIASITVGTYYGQFLNLQAPNHDLLLLCMQGDTLIETDLGNRAICTLSIDDLVLTSDGNCKPIRWIGSQKVEAKGKLRPIRIIAGALGQGLPKRDLLVSRQHRMVVSSQISGRMFDGDVLIPAIKLTELPGIFVDEDIEEVEYFHLLFDQHEVIFAEGAPTESLYTGPEALRAVSPEAREEILTLFPKLEHRDYRSESALPIPALKRQKKLVDRHRANTKPLLESFHA